MEDLCTGLKYLTSIARFYNDTEKDSVSKTTFLKFLNFFIQWELLPKFTVILKLSLGLFFNP